MNKRNISIFLVLMSVLLSPALACADQVIVGDRVISHVNVREKPTSRSNIVGRLGKNDTAELIESAPYWHKVRLENSTVGYVSKAWTLVVTLAGQIGPARGKTDLIIGSWYINGLGFHNQDRRDYQRMAHIIQGFDVVAIQGLRDSRYRGRLDKLVNELLNRGYRYAYVVSAPTGYQNHPDRYHPTQPKSNHVQRYAFMWDVDRVKRVNPAKPCAFVSLPPINNDTFRHVPVYTDFKVTDGNGFDFRILTIHTVYDKNMNAVRRAELQFIHNWIINQTADTAYAEKNIIVIGNFNANPENQPHHFNEIIAGTHQYRVLMNESLQAGEPSRRTTVQRESNPDPSYFESPVYDHALVSNETSYALPHNPMTRSANDLGIVEFDQDEHWQALGDWDAMIRAMSDHRPIWFRMNYKAEDRD